MLFLFKALISLLVVVNPIDSTIYFLTLTADRPAEERRAIVHKAVTAATVFLLAAIWFGELLLSLLGISIGAFAVGGGLMMLVMAMAMAMLQARPSALERTPAETEEAAGRESIAIVPLAMPLMVGPGVLSMAVLLADQAGGIGGRIGLTLVAGVVMGILWWLLRKAEPVVDWLGETGANVLIRIAGMILAAISVQIIADGLVQLFPGLAGLKMG
ncbi:multiple antibiotic resistance protein [Methylomarinovum caldicuralii]|uniref:UPF0056 membrane protein n=1 Tax=Methylomarinovum caldicuralii TaxID=438856 RepID=A0AAU9C2F4_9GAMM|nr:MarC family protein [Methylomarinovum caldicuralii]BCX81778.1 multiple antibiotic resistance protein [Methylomarinovum caldicuralii]